MDKKQAKNLIKNTLESPFDKENFEYFVRNLLKSFDNNPDAQFTYSGQYIPEAYREYIKSFSRIGKYQSNGNEIDILLVRLQKETSLYRARTMQRNFIARYLNGSRGGKQKDAALVAFVSPDNKEWRFSLVKMDYRFEETLSGKNKVKEEFTPARRWSFLVGENEKSHTAESRFLPIIENDNFYPTLEDLEQVFNVEKVTEDFYEAYRYALNEIIIKSLDEQSIEYRNKQSFAQQLLSRILFVYFLQRKGWLKWKDYEQDKNYLRNLWEKYKSHTKIKNTFYSHWLGSLFFGAFNKKSQFINSDLPEEIKKSFAIMPFLNGGLFSKNEIDALEFHLPDSIFEWLFEPDQRENQVRKGFLEIFNFTIDEASPFDIEVAVDPEMLGKVYESLIAQDERGNAGIFYTPRVEIDFMCRLSLVNYMHSKTNIDKNILIDLIFSPEKIIDHDNIENLKLLKENLDSVKIVDPAVGSASFLVGMMNILVDIFSFLTKKLEGREENLFAVKHKVILNNLYGVDVKDWAVMVGELRLWLALIIDTDEKFMDIYTKPLLPNLSFKIRQGDSLVEDIGGVFVNLRGESLKQIPNQLHNKIRELIDRKAEFFAGQRSADLKEAKDIEYFENEIFKDILQEKLNALNQQVESKTRSLTQIEGTKTLFGEESEKTKKEIKKLTEEIDQHKTEIKKYQDAIYQIGQNGKKDYFLWELDFAEVFAINEGFDIVIGNPPYVRHELIAPPLENEKNFSADDWRERKKEYKEKLIRATQTVWNEVKKVDKKSDLYIYFYYQGLSLLNKNGIFCFINSNSWIDVGYGAGLQEFLLKNMKPIYIIDNIAKRSFKQADVNTVIVVIQKPEKKLEDFTLKFVAFKKSFEKVINPDVLKEIEQANRPIFDNPNFRVYPKTKKELLEEGVEYPDDTEIKLEHPVENLPYIGNKWGGKYLRAPEIYFKILENGKDKLVRLGDIAEVKAGIITGNNSYYYKPKTENFDTYTYSLVFKSPREVKKIFLTKSDTLSIIKIKNVPFEIRKAPLLWVDLRGDKHICHLNFDLLPFEHNFYGISGIKIDNTTLCLILNSTLTLFFVEILGRKGLGGGAIRMVKIDLSNLPVPNIPKLDFSKFNPKP